MVDLQSCPSPSVMTAVQQGVGVALGTGAWVGDAFGAGWGSSGGGGPSGSRCARMCRPILCSDIGSNEWAWRTSVSFTMLSSGSGVFIHHHELWIGSSAPVDRGGWLQPRERRHRTLHKVHLQVPDEAAARPDVVRRGTAC